MRLVSLALITSTALVSALPQQWDGPPQAPPAPGSSGWSQSPQPWNGDSSQGSWNNNNNNDNNNNNGNGGSWNQGPPPSNWPQVPSPQGPPPQDNWGPSQGWPSGPPPPAPPQGWPSGSGPWTQEPPAQNGGGIRLCQKSLGCFSKLPDGTTVLEGGPGRFEYGPGGWRATGNNGASIGNGPGGWKVQPWGPPPNSGPGGWTWKN